MLIQSSTRAALLSVLIVLSFTGCGAGNNTDSSSAEPVEKAEHTDEQGGLHLSEAEKQQAGIAVQEVATQAIKDQLVLTANIVANQDRLAHVTPRVEGKLIEVPAKLGDEVKPGQSLAVIDSIQMGEARAELRRAQSELDLAKANFERNDRLYEEQVVSQKQWLEAKSALERAQSAANAQRERLRMYGGLGHDGGSTYIVTAPFAGMVIEKNMVIGELARPTDVLFTVADLSQVWIEADVTEADLGKLRIGAPTTITVTAFPDMSFAGKVSYISSIVDRDTRTVKARIEIPNPEGRLRIGMFARASLGLESTQQVIVVPADAVFLMQGQSTVYVADGDAFEAHPVELGMRVPDGVVVSDGLNSGDQIVVKGAYTLKARQLKSQISDEH